jgi:hypothetical protein
MRRLVLLIVIASTPTSAAATAAQRELRQLRRAVALWKLGHTDQAAREAARAADTDEEAVRSAAFLLLTAADLAGAYSWCASAIPGTGTRKVGSDGPVRLPT